MEVVAEGGQVDGTSNERPVDGNTFPQPAQSGGAGEEVQEAQTRHYSTRKDIPATSTEWGAEEDNRQDKTELTRQDRIAPIPHSRNQHRVRSLRGGSQQDRTS